MGDSGIKAPVELHPDPEKEESAAHTAQGVYTRWLAPRYRGHGKVGIWFRMRRITRWHIEKKTRKVIGSLDPAQGAGLHVRCSMYHVCCVGDRSKRRFCGLTKWLQKVNTRLPGTCHSGNARGGEGGGGVSGEGAQHKM